MKCFLVDFNNLDNLFCLFFINKSDIKSNLLMTKLDIWRVASSSGLPTTRETKRSEQVQQVSTKTIKGLEHLSYEERVKRARTVQPGEEKAQRDLIKLYKCLIGGGKRGGIKKLEPDSSHWCPKKGPEAMSMNQEIPFQCKKSLSYGEGSQTLQQVAQSGCGDSTLGDTQNPAGHGLEHLSLGDPCSSWTR